MLPWVYLPVVPVKRYAFPSFAATSLASIVASVATGSGMDCGTLTVAPVQYFPVAGANVPFSVKLGFASVSTGATFTGEYPPLEKFVLRLWA